MDGLSPPTRGSLSGSPRRPGRRRSIPAHAGKPKLGYDKHARDQVYPRPRGEARTVMAAASPASGLSPPTRGSRRRAGRGTLRRRSIPAHAGKPGRAPAASTRTAVYPRPRGEAHRRRGAETVRDGLSPPTRGSLANGWQGTRIHRSIPAHAGKPRSPYVYARALPVYPRPRGEACSETLLPSPLGGLSPPTRGSQARRCAPIQSQGSIPAHAGKPILMTYLPMTYPVYPRPRGEAGDAPDEARCNEGLSPPTRGSPIDVPDEWHGYRSIPAHAGKPAIRRRRPWCTSVYPRPRGEASMPLSASTAATGLSPPTRGSHSPPAFGSRNPGSIPAHAGKP